MKQRFFVDWNDPSFPQIRPIEQAVTDEVPLTITEARQEIIDHFGHLIDHGRAQTRRARTISVVQIMEEARIG